MTIRKIGGCFVAGTLVHTSDGLVPIERIRVGDLVLSKPESGEGEPSYQRVINRVKFEGKEVWYVGFERQGSTAAQFEEATGFVICTPNHPFWVADMEDWAIGTLGDYRNRWVRADRLNMGMVVQLADGQRANIVLGSRLLRTAKPNVGFMRYSFEGESENVGSKIDFGGPTPFAYPMKGLGSLRDGLLPNDILGWESMEEDNLALRMSVYHLEVEATHTYFVDWLGVWVHNSNETWRLASTPKDWRY